MMEESRCNQYKGDKFLLLLVLLGPTHQEQVEAILGYKELIDGASLENGQILHEEELAVLADPRITEGQATQIVITHNEAYQADDMDAYDSDCAEINTANVALMANLSYYSLNVLAEFSIVETDKVIHTIETDIVKLMVEIESFGMSSDDFDKDTVSFDELQRTQEALSCVHALSELHLHESHVVPSKHEADQY
nr:hypothetical protein [Tanacetum cinerariifolium]